LHWSLLLLLLLLPLLLLLVLLLLVLLLLVLLLLLLDICCCGCCCCCCCCCCRFVLTPASLSCLLVPRLPFLDVRPRLLTWTPLSTQGSGTCLSTHSQMKGEDSTHSQMKGEDQVHHAPLFAATI
jgi:hypothetical protein